MKRLLIYLSLLMICGTTLAQTSLVVPDLSVPTKIAPAYFGPNAFPVPDILTGRTSSVWKLEAYVDNYISTTYRWSEDYTASTFLRLTIPLFSDRANLVIWGISRKSMCTDIYRKGAWVPVSTETCTDGIGNGSQ